MLLILLPLPNIPTAIRIPQHATAIPLPKPPLPLVPAAILVDLDAIARLLAVFEFADVE